MYNLNRIVGYLGDWLVRHPTIATTAVIVLVSILSLDLTLMYYLRFYYDLLEDRDKDNIQIPICFVFFCMVCKIVLFVTMLVEYFSPFRQFRDYMDKRQKRRFASFIVRRLLYQLDMASRTSSGLIKGNIYSYNSQNLLYYQQASDAAYRAVDIFRRDANAILVQRLPITNGDTQFFILDEEEESLCEAGYSHIELDVTEKVLQDLVSPQISVEALNLSLDTSHAIPVITTTTTTTIS